MFEYKLFQRLLLILYRNHVNCAKISSEELESFEYFSVLET